MACQGERDKMPCRLTPSKHPVSGNNTLYQPWEIPANNNYLVLEEERAIVSGVQIRAATIDGLLDYLIQSFSPSNGLAEESDRFPYATLLMHQWFVSSQDLAQKLVAFFWRSEKRFVCSVSCRHTKDTASTCLVYQYRTRVCYTFRYWIMCFPIHFDLDTSLAKALHDFQRSLRERGQRPLADLVDISKIPSYEWTRNISVRNPLLKHTRKVSLVFDHLESNELADHLTFLEHRVMSRITFMDFKAYAKTGMLQDNPKLERSIALFNGLTQWIQCMVLSRSLPQQRADVIAKFVDVAKRLLDLNNFNTLMAVVSGLNHSALARLTLTKNFVSPETKRSLDEMTELLSSTTNFSNYRKRLSESKGFRIPFLGVHMKDLISLNTALPDHIDSGLINFRKVAHLSLIFQELWELQNSSPPTEVNLDLVNTLRLSLDMAYTEDEIYELSLTREPRNSSSPQLSPTKPTMFSEWAAGVSAGPDPETLERHVHAVVEAVFKKYDTDRDGKISRKEFEGVSTNFPLLDTFKSLDSDQDGLITKGEMKRYFMQASCHHILSSFRHNFHETSYFKPTFCAHCTGLLWGLFKQGFKCRECGINAHKHCKDLVVMECSRSSNNPTGRSHSFTAGDGATIKIRIQRHLRRQHKNSQSESDAMIRKISLEMAERVAIGYNTVPNSPTELLLPNGVGLGEM